MNLYVKTFNIGRKPNKIQRRLQSNRQQFATDGFDSKIPTMMLKTKQENIETMKNELNYNNWPFFFLTNTACLTSACDSTALNLLLIEMEEIFDYFGNGWKSESKFWFFIVFQILMQLTEPTRRNSFTKIGDSDLKIQLFAWEWIARFESENVQMHNEIWFEWHAENCYHCVLKTDHFLRKIHIFSIILISDVRLFHSHTRIPYHHGSVAKSRKTLRNRRFLLQLLWLVLLRCVFFLLSFFLSPSGFFIVLCECWFFGASLLFLVQWVHTTARKLLLTKWTLNTS